MDVSVDSGENLAVFLESIDLKNYYEAIKNELKVETVQQLKEVEDQELEDIRMKKEDIQKLKKSLKKEYPQSTFGKLKKIGSLNAVVRSISMKRFSKMSNDSTTFKNSRGSVMSMSSEPVHSPPPVVGRRIIPREQIDVQEDIGQGEFGIVRKAIYTNDIGQKIEVAVKSLSQDRFQHGLQEFLKEASSMQSVSHSNIVTFYGIVFQQDKELMLVTEYAPFKSLLECLHDTSMRKVLTIKRLCEFSHQISTGMTYLEAQGLIHRDLAARNILVFAQNKVKIGDFGLSRALGLEKEYYQSKYRTDLKLPIAWCAPECITLLRFSSASDVWSFGVTMWEMFTYGKKPWEGLSSNEILKAIDVQKQERLPRPDLCPTENYGLLLKCWAHDPEDRPKFADITSELGSMKPTIMKAIKPSKPGSGCLEFSEGDSITVIDKKPNEAPSWQYWKGVLNNGVSGYFNPTDCVPIQPESSPLPGRNVKQNLATKKTLKKNRSPEGQKKKKFTADMIGQPQGDLRHTGHIGYDGVTFGDISFIGKEPVERIIPLKGSGSGSSTLKSTHSGSSGHLFINGDGLTQTDSPHSSDPSQLEDFEELNDFKIPDLSFSESLDFGTSFIDEMMKELKTGDRYNNKNENNNSNKSTSSSLTNGLDVRSTNESLASVVQACASSNHYKNINCHSQTDQPYLNIERLQSDICDDDDELRARHNASMNHCPNNTNTANGSHNSFYNAAHVSNNGLDLSDHASSDETSNKKPFNKKWKASGKPKLILPGCSLKSMSAADERLIDDAINMANQLACTSLSQANTPKDFEDQPETPSKSKFKFSFKLPGTKRSSPKIEKKSFTDDLALRKDITAVTPEAEEAYNILVAKGTLGRCESGLKYDTGSSLSLSKEGTHSAQKSHTSTLPSQFRHSKSSFLHSKSLDRPKQPPPLPPLELRRGKTLDYTDDVCDIPNTPAPPIPTTASSVRGNTIAEPSYDNMDPFWREEMKIEHDKTQSSMSDKYRISSDTVSCEDLELSEDHTLVKHLQSIVGAQISKHECFEALKRTDGQLPSAVKYIKLKQLVKLKLGSIELCKVALMKCNWNVQLAADYILDNNHIYNNEDVIGV